MVYVIPNPQKDNNGKIYHTQINISKVWSEVVPMSQHSNDNRCVITNNEVDRAQIEDRRFAAKTMAARKLTARKLTARE